MIHRFFYNKRKAAVLISLFFCIFLALSAFAGWSLSGSRQKLEVVSENGVIMLTTGDFDSAKIENYENIYSALDRLTDTYGFKNVRDELEPSGTVPMQYGTLYKLAQYYNGVPVYGRELKVAVDKNGKILSVSGNYLRNIYITAPATVSPADACIAAEGFESGASAISCNLEIYSLFNTVPVYAYNIVTDFSGGTRYFIDANSGDLVVSMPVSGALADTASKSAAGLLSPQSVTGTTTQQISTTQTDYNNRPVLLDVEVSADGTYYLADALRNINVLDAKSSESYGGSLITSRSGSFTDKVAVSTFANLVSSFDFYTDPDNIGTALFGVDGSLNQVHGDEDANDEMRVTGVVHYGYNYENAFYLNYSAKQSLFCFGDGNMSSAYYFGTAKDAVGHEYQHAVTANITDLVYFNASGALNEAYSDIFGALIEGYELSDRNFWLIGEDCTASGTMRDMSNPRRLGYPDKVSNKYDFCYSNHNHRYCDNGGVHINANIITHSVYQMYQSSLAAGSDIINKSNIGKLFYTALGLMSPDADWAQFRLMVTQAAGMIGLSFREQNDLITHIDYGFDYVGFTAPYGTFSIQFNSAGFSGTVPETITGNYGDSFVIPATDMSKAGYVFAGWSDHQEYNPDAKIYFPGTTYRFLPYSLILYPVFRSPLWNGYELTTLYGAGTAASPYLIGSEEDFATLAYFIDNQGLIAENRDYNGKHFQLTRSLDLGSNDWLPIGGNTGTPVSVYLDGAGFEISNLSITGNHSAAGLFGYFSGTITGLTVSGTIAASSAFSGAFAGVLSNGSISKSHSNVNIINTNADGVSGGIAGAVTGYNKLSVSNSYNTGSIESPAAGGIVGYSAGKSGVMLGNVYNTGAVKGVTAGGIAGAAKNTVIVNAINTGTVSPLSPTQAAIGGIVGKLDNISHADSILYPSSVPDAAFSALLGTKNTGVVAVQAGVTSGGIAGIISRNTHYIKNNIFKGQGVLAGIGNQSDLGEKNTIENLRQSQDALYTGDFDFDNQAYFDDNSIWEAANGINKFDLITCWEVNENVMPSLRKSYDTWINRRAESFESGIGSSADPFIIANGSQLALLAYYVNSDALTLEGENYRKLSYALGGDIDLSGMAWYGIGTRITPADSQTSSYSPFEGSFDGRGFTIKNMHALEYSGSGFASGDEQHFSPAGLFSYVRSPLNSVTAVLKNIKLENCAVTGNESAAGLINSVLNYNTSVIDCEIISGKITAQGEAGGFICSIGTNAKVIVSGSKNNAAVSALVSGGIAAATSSEVIYSGIRSVEISASINSGEVSNYISGTLTAPAITGGIIGIATNSTVTNNIILGNIINFCSYGSAGSLAGGILLDSESSGRVSFTASYNKSVAQIITHTPPLRAGSLLGGVVTKNETGTTVVVATISHNTYRSSLSPAGFTSDGTVVIRDTDNTQTADEAYDGVFSFNNTSYYEVEANYFVDITDHELARLMLMLYNRSGYSLVIFTDWDESIVAKTEVVTGSGTAAHSPLSRPDTNSEHFTFAGWDKDLSKIEKNTVVTALYSSETRFYTVRFYSHLGELLKTDSVEYGAASLPPEIANSFLDGFFKFIFSSWDGNPDRITADTDLTAKYIAEDIVIIYYDEDGHIIDEQQLNFGEQSQEPEIAETKKQGLTLKSFTGWQQTFDEATGTIIYRATYSEKLSNEGYALIISAGALALALIATTVLIIILKARKRKKAKL